MKSSVSYLIDARLPQDGSPPAVHPPAHLATADFIRQLSHPRSVQVSEPIVNPPDALPDALLAQAKTGVFRAIACWLNVYLLPQGISAWVGEACPAYLQVTVTVRRPPHRDRLIRFICHQLCQLDSEVIRGAHLAVRLANTSFILWQQLIQLPTAEPAKPLPVVPKAALPVVNSVRTTFHLTRESVLQQLQGLRDGHSFQLKRPQRATPSPPLPIALPTPVTPRLDRTVQRPRLLPIGGAAIAVLVIGSGLEMLIHHWSRNEAGPSRSSTATDMEELAEIYGGPLPIGDWVQTSAGTIPVTPLYPPPSAGQDGAITLLFSHPAAIATRSGGGLHRPGRRTTVPFQRDLLRQAEVTMTALDAALHLEDRQTAPDADAIATLRRQGVDVVNAAHSPLLGVNPDVLDDTLRALHQQTIRTAGIGDDPQQKRRPQVLEVRGQRIAYLGYAEPSSPALADGGANGVNMGTRQHLATDIRAIRDQVDWVIVNYQWQRAIAPNPDQSQMDLARYAIDQGADLVVGHHPTVMQGAEIYKGRAIAYSLGQIEPLRGTDVSSADLDTAILRVDLQETEMRVEFVPIQVRQGKAAIASGESARSILQTVTAAATELPTPLTSPATLKVHPAQREFPFIPPSLGPEAPTDQPEDSFISGSALVEESDKLAIAKSIKATPPAPVRAQLEAIGHRPRK